MQSRAEQSVAQPGVLNWGEGYKNDDNSWRWIWPSDGLYTTSDSAVKTVDPAANDDMLAIFMTEIGCPNPDPGTSGAAAPCGAANYSAIRQAVRVFTNVQGNEPPAWFTDGEIVNDPSVASYCPIWFNDQYSAEGGYDGDPAKQPLNWPSDLDSEITAATPKLYPDIAHFLDPHLLWGNAVVDDTQGAGGPIWIFGSRGRPGGCARTTAAPDGPINGKTPVPIDEAPPQTIPVTPRCGGFKDCSILDADGDPDPTCAPECSPGGIDAKLAMAFSYDDLRHHDRWLFFYEDNETDGICDFPIPGSPGDFSGVCALNVPPTTPALRDKLWSVARDISPEFSVHRMEHEGSQGWRSSLGVN